MSGCSTVLSGFLCHLCFCIGVAAVNIPELNHSHRGLNVCLFLFLSIINVRFMDFFVLISQLFVHENLMINGV